MKYLLSIIISLLFLSCGNNNSNKQSYNIKDPNSLFYETGEIRYKEEKLNEYTYRFRQFYKTGQIQFEGMVQNSESEGIWRWYHSDGAIHTVAKFHKGNVLDLDKIISENQYYVIFEIEGNPKEIKVGNSYHFRFRLINLWYYDVSALTEILGVIMADDNSPYPFKFTPRKTGIANINLNLTDKEGNTLKTIPYEIKVQ